MSDDITTSVVEPTPASAEQTTAISEDVIKSHPLYKSLLEESIQRRQKIAEMKTEMEKLQKPADPTPTATLDVDAITRQVLAQVEAKEAQKQAHASLIDRVMSETKVSPTVRDVLVKFTDETTMRTVAESLVKAGLNFAPTPTGGNGAVEKDSIMKAINDKLGIK